jgi:hypothetical protein
MSTTMTVLHAASRLARRKPIHDSQLCEQCAWSIDLAMRLVTDDPGVTTGDLLDAFDAVGLERMRLPVVMERLTEQGVVQMIGSGWYPAG